MTATANTTIFDGIARILDEVAEVELTGLDLRKSLREDLDVDSLLLVEIMVAIESEFGVSISDEEAAGFVTLGDIVDFIDDSAAAA